MERKARPAPSQKTIHLNLLIGRNKGYEVTNKTFTLEGIQDLRKPGLYFLYKNDELVYIGISKNIYVRILEHCFDNKKDFDSMKAYENDIGFEYTFLEVMEVFLIAQVHPKYNRLIVEDTYSFFNTLPSIAKEVLGKTDFETMTKAKEKMLFNINKKGYEV